VSTLAPGTARGRRMASPLRALVTWSQRNGLFYALAALVAVFAVSSHRFLTGSNIEVIFLQISVTGLVAVPGAMLILSGYIDLAVGSIAVLASVVVGELTVRDGIPSLWAALAAAAVGLAWGCMQGYLVSYLGFSPIVVTLGGLAGARGVAEYVTKGETQYGLGPGFGQLGNAQVLGLDVPIIIFAGIFLAGSYAWYQMPYGRRMTAIGSDRTVARSLGIAVRRIPFVLYALSGLAAALGGLILTSQLDGSSYSIGEGMELEVLTGILLGGVAFVGGRGSLLGVLFGVLFIGVLTNGLTVLNISPFIRNVAIGGALLFAAALDVLYQRLDRVPAGEDTGTEGRKRGILGFAGAGLRRTR
jgi:ribose transport system permease protein